MKKLLLILTLFFTACSDERIILFETDYIDGVVSEKEYTYFHYGSYYYLYVSNSKSTNMVEVPCDIYNKYEKGDSCLLLIKKYKVNDEK
jgi:hypothetical protein